MTLHERVRQLIARALAYEPRWLQERRLRLDDWDARRLARAERAEQRMLGDEHVYHWRTHNHDRP